MKIREFIAALAIIAIAVIGCTTHKIVTEHDSQVPIELFQVGMEYPIIVETGIGIDTTITRLKHIEVNADSIWEWMEFTSDSGEVFIVKNYQ